MSGVDRREASQRWWQFGPIRTALIGGALATLGLVAEYAFGVAEGFVRPLYLAAGLFGGLHWVRETVEELTQHRKLGIGALMLTAAVGACVLDMWDEAAFLIFLYGAAEGVEEYTYERTRRAIRDLLDLAPPTATALRGGREEEVPAETLKPGDVFLVRPGGAVATDGVIRSGRSDVNEASITGESVPVEKPPGSHVFAGSINGRGLLEVEATTAFADNTLAKIVHLVESAQEQKGRAQRWIDRFGERYTPAVLVVALGLAVVPWLSGGDWREWSARAVVLLVAAAPCALVMSMPVAMAAGIEWGGRRGILIKGGVHLEHLGSIRAVAFDKTGTLTEGAPAVTDVLTVHGDERTLGRIAAGIERASEHPLGRAIVGWAASREIPAASTQDFEALIGAGASATVDGVRTFAGSPELFVSRGIAIDGIAAEVERLQGEGKTVVLVGDEQRVRGAFAIADPVRREASVLVRLLLARGLHVTMLTGDNVRTARAVGAAVGISDVHAGLKPQDKVNAIRELERKVGNVLMVGDGVNDAPALAAATCGVAMGVAGSDAAIEAADVALMANDLAKIEDALALGARVQRVSRQNIIFSLAILAAMIPAAVTNVIGVTVTVFVHEASELLAVLNGLRVASRRERVREP